MALGFLPVATKSEVALGSQPVEKMQATRISPGRGNKLILLEWHPKLHSDVWFLMVRFQKVSYAAKKQIMVNELVGNGFIEFHRVPDHCMVQQDVLLGKPFSKLTNGAAKHKPRR